MTLVIPGNAALSQECLHVDKASCKRTEREREKERKRERERLSNERPCQMELDTVRRINRLARRAVRG